MKPWRTLAQAPSGLILRERDGEFVIYSHGQVLMTSRASESEKQMANYGCTAFAADNKAPRVLIGGLGMGYTLRACLDVLPKSAKVTVAEISPAVLEWNQGPLAHLAKYPLKDKRVVVEVMDVGLLVDRSKESFDAILMDVDNGPQALAQKSNHRLYSPVGISQLFTALKPAGHAVIWSAKEDQRFKQMLQKTGFEVTQKRVPASLSGGGTHILFVATK